MVDSYRRLTLHRYAMQSVAPTMGYNKDRAADFARGASLAASRPSTDLYLAQFLRLIEGGVDFTPC
jgi:hypothetical protein